MRIIGIDPGTGRLGWAIVEKERGREVLLDCGCLETPARTELPPRLEFIFNELNQIISRYQPQAASVEDLFFANNQKTVISVAAARGVALLACQLAGLKIASYTPLQIKSSLTGYGAADKKQVEYMVKQILKRQDIKQLDDAIDAVAVALTHFSFAGARMTP